MTPKPDGDSLRYAHYRVEPGPDGRPLELGRGAMGVTYKAFDERLRIEVALKVITPGQVDDTKAQALFLREARAAAQVHHPNVAGVVFLNDIPGDFFYAMEFVEGETVEALVKRQGPLSVRLALRIILQAAQGLAAANERGLIHRDIKPANLMLAHQPNAEAETEDDDELLVKVIDFGLAKSIHAEEPGAAISLTGHGPVGTPNYMSPEQISPTGEPLDARTDIYSLGVTLWYLLMGRPPFDGTQFQVLSQQLQSPPPWEKLEAAGVPPDVETLLKSMLSKRPEDRPANYPALISALKKLLRSGSTSGGQVLAPAAAIAATDATMPSGAPNPLPSRRRVAMAVIAAVVALVVAGLGWRTLRKDDTKSAAAPPEKSVAVLPFDNLSSDQENAFFANGMQDEILTDLSRIADLKVISRSSVQQYKTGVARNLKEIGQALGVRYVLEGSVQRVGGKVRVTAQLIDTRTDAHVWANRYDRDLADVFGIQTEVAENIATQLKARLSDSEKAAIAEHPTADLTAYDLYLRARQINDEGFAQLNTKANTLQAIRMVEEAVARDPNFLAAWCLLADLHDGMVWFDFDRSPARLALAQTAVDRAVRLRPKAGETQLAQAKHAYWGYRDYQRAREHLAAAERALPNNWEVPYITGLIDRREGRWDSANRNIERALNLNPRSLLVLSELATASYSLQRRYDDGLRAGQRIEALLPKEPEYYVLVPVVELERSANPIPLQERIASLIEKNPSTASNLALTSIFLAFKQRDGGAARRALSLLPRSEITDQVNSSFTYPYQFFAGVVARMEKDPATAQEQFTAARIEAAARVASHIDDAKAIMVLALIDAYLGRKDDALRGARQSCELLPISKDALDGAGLEFTLAVVAALTGEKELAITQLKKLGRIPSAVNYGELVLDPNWDPLRGDPRFEAIVASLAPAKK